MRDLERSRESGESEDGDDDGEDGDEAAEALTPEGVGEVFEERILLDVCHAFVCYTCIDGHAALYECRPDKSRFFEVAEGVLCRLGAAQSGSQICLFPYLGEVFAVCELLEYKALNLGESHSFHKEVVTLRE